MCVTDLEKGCEPICDDPLTPAWQPLGRYTDEYNRIYERILALEFQINMLEKNREQLKIAAFDQHIHQLNIELCMRKAEIEPIILLLCEVLSRSNLEKDKEYFVERFFLRRSTREIATSHNVTDQIVTASVNRCNKMQVPHDVIEKYGKVFKR